MPDEGASEEVHDAGELGCGDGLAAWFRERLRETPTGVVLCSVVRDPSARVELPALARLMGQRVVSVEALDEGLAIRVEKIT
ncbi:MAG: sulfurtransferase TusA family protein [Microthrixaceae bacterium]